MFPNTFATLVLIEDDAGHARLIERNLRRAQVSHDLVVFHEGEEALDYLSTQRGGVGRQPDRSFLVLLDLNLPGLDGYQVLERLKQDDRTQHIPVVVLTSTDDPHEMERCYVLGCNAYVTKPVDYDRFMETIGKLGLLLSIVSIPHGESYVGLAESA